MSKILTACIIIPTAAVVGLFAYLGSFSHLMADDYCSIYFAERLGILRSVWYWYINWHGGFSASFADGLLRFLGRGGVGYAMPLTLIVWVLSLAWAIASVLGSFQLRWRGLIALALSLLVLFGTLLVSPTTAASLIWWGGLRGYAPPLIIMPVYMALYMLFRNHEHRSSMSRYVWYALSFGMLFISGGFSEPFTPLQVIIVFLMLLAELYVRRDVARNQGVRFLTAGILGGVVALVIMILAPGNAARQGFYPPPPPPLGILMIGLRSYLAFLARMGNDPFSIVTAAALFGSSVLLGTSFPKSKYFNLRNLLIIVLLGLAFAFCSFLPAAYGQSGAPSDTSLITPVYILMIMLSAAGTVGGGIFVMTMQTIKPQHVLVPVALVLLSLGYSTFIAVQRISDEIGRATAYTENWDKRDLQIRRAKQDGLREVYVPAIPRWITEEPTDNPKFFVNQCMSLYYGINILSSPNASE